jgi:NADPH:quinone reductase-like Zn-dependent oxidoreductase
MKSVAAKANKKELDFLSGLFVNGRIRPAIDRTYPFEKGEEAIEYISQGYFQVKHAPL